MTTNQTRPKVFVSYSHRDRNYFSRLQTHLAFFALNHEIAIWSDVIIKPGQEWDREIRTALESAEIAVLLVSSDFLASSYIRDVELPTIVRAADTRNLRVFPVILSPCAYDRSDLARFQAANAVSRPMSKMNRNSQEELWVKVAGLIVDALRERLETREVRISLAELSEHGLAMLMDRFLTAVYGLDAVVKPEPNALGTIRPDLVLLDPDPICGGKLVVELKKSSNRKVDDSSIHQVVAYMTATESAQGVIITTGSFTEAALDHAQRSNIRLIGGTQLVELMRRYGFNVSL
jgi:hypothetical protein